MVVITDKHIRTIKARIIESSKIYLAYGILSKFKSLDNFRLKTNPRLSEHLLFTVHFCLPSRISITNRGSTGPRGPQELGKITI